MFRKLLELVTKKQEANEGVFDTDFSKEVNQRYGDTPSDMSQAERDKIDMILNTPDARPGDFDGTLEAWLFRISIWGKIKITHKDPDLNRKRNMSNYEFLYYVDNQQKNNDLGLWEIRMDKVNRIVFHRSYWGIKGKQVTEEIIVDIKLRPDLQKIITKARRKLGLFGQFS